MAALAAARRDLAAAAAVTPAGLEDGPAVAGFWKKEASGYLDHGLFLKAKLRKVNTKTSLLTLQLKYKIYFTLWLKNKEQKNTVT